LCVYVCIVLIYSAAKLQVCFNKLTLLYYQTTAAELYVMLILITNIIKMYIYIFINQITSDYARHAVEGKGKGKGSLYS